MPQFLITLPKGTRLDTAVKTIQKAFPEINVQVQREDPPESRADRYQLAMRDAESAKYIIEELKEELQEWRDNLPENLQSSSKADELDEAIGELEQVNDELDEAMGHDVNFPSMM